MAEKDKPDGAGIERRQNLVVLPGKRHDAEPPADKAAAVEEAIHSCWKPRETSVAF